MNENERADELARQLAGAAFSRRCFLLHDLLATGLPHIAPALRAHAAHFADPQLHQWKCPVQQIHPAGLTRYFAVLEQAGGQDLAGAVIEMDRNRTLPLDTLIWLSARRSARTSRQAQIQMSYRDDWLGVQEEAKREPLLNAWLREGRPLTPAELVDAVRFLADSASLPLRQLALRHAGSSNDAALLAVMSALLRRETDAGFRKELVKMVCNRASFIDLDALLAVTELGDEQQRSLILAFLPLDREPAAYRRVQDLLFCDPSLEVRKFAAGRLLYAKELPYVGVPMRVTLSQDQELRGMGIELLARHPEPEARARLVKLATTDPAGGLRAAAAKRVAGWDGVTDIEALLAMTHDEVPRVRRLAVQALAKRTGPEARARFREMIESEGDGAVRAMLMRHFRRAVDGADLPSVERALALARGWPAGRYGRERTVHALEVARWRIVHGATVQPMDPESLLRHPRGDVRRRAALELVRRKRPPGGPRAADLIERAMREDGGRPRLTLEEAAAALCELRDERDLPQLAALLMRRNERPLREGDARMVIGFLADGGLPCARLLLGEVQRWPSRYDGHGMVAIDRAARCLARMRDPQVDAELAALATGPYGAPRWLADRARALRKK
jgi:HEAT repeat protein